MTMSSDTASTGEGATSGTNALSDQRQGDEDDEAAMGGQGSRSGHAKASC